MNEREVVLVSIVNELEALCAKATAEARSDATVQAWAKVQLAVAKAFDEHVTELQQLAESNHSSPRLSTFMKVQNGDDIHTNNTTKPALLSASVDSKPTEENDNDA